MSTIETPTHVTCPLRPGAPLIRLCAARESSPAVQLHVGARCSLGAYHPQCSEPTPASRLRVLVRDVPGDGRTTRRLSSTDGWAEPRPFIGGHAARAIPPYMGQGGGHAMRDAANRAWNLPLLPCGTADGWLIGTYEPRQPARRRTDAFMPARTRRQLHRPSSSSCFH
ncbi:FAD-dependent monooxygenase [Paraburkholderia sp. MM5496-R1]|uniref:FAD-dependent monooxygenase n=1 Tax=Paraburkholderia sp. MM5496-R1 TaxID=2991065 RepID=UPI003D25A14A